MFKKHTPLKEILGDDPAGIISFIVGNSLVMIFFISIGVCLLAYVKHSKNRFEATWMAWCFILCGISRALSIMNVWYGYYTLNSIFATITGLAAMVTLVLIMKITKDLYSMKDIDTINREIMEVEDRLRILQKLKSENASGNNMA